MPSTDRTPEQRRRARRLAIFGLCVWAAAFAVFVLTEGFPTKRTAVLMWIVLAVFAGGMGDIRRTWKSLLFEWAPVFAALAMYDRLRGASDGVESSAHTWPQLDFDEAVGFGRIPTVRLQELLHVPGVVRWYDYAAWGVYISHFIMPLLAAAVLFAFRSRLFRPYVLGIVLLSWMGLATYALYPAQPPWMTGRDGLHEPTPRIVQGMWEEVGVDRAAKVWTTKRSERSDYANRVAALPSLHAAFPMFLLCMLWRAGPGGRRRRVIRALLVAYTLAMALTLVYSGEHFTFDIVLGWAYALTAAGIVIGAQKWWGASRCRTAS